MARGKWKVPFVQNSILKKIVKNNKGRELKIYSRNSQILPFFSQVSVLVTNGQRWVSLKWSDRITYNKFGQFANTRKKANHQKKKNKR